MKWSEIKTDNCYFWLIFFSHASRVALGVVTYAHHLDPDWNNWMDSDENLNTQFSIPEDVLADFHLTP